MTGSMARKRLLLELWHGPTCAFKDMALQILPHFLTTALQKAGGGKEAVILTATSGDTGKAALEGFKDVPGTRISGLLPPGRRQSLCRSARWPPRKGANVAVCGHRGQLRRRPVQREADFYRPQASQERLAQHRACSSPAPTPSTGAACCPR